MGGILFDSPTCPTWYSGVGRTVGSRAALGYGYIPLDSPTCPMWYSRIGRTVGCRAALGYGRHCNHRLVGTCMWMEGGCS